MLLMEEILDDNSLIFWSILTCLSSMLLSLVKSSSWVVKKNLTEEGMRLSKKVLSSLRATKLGTPGWEDWESEEDEEEEDDCSEEFGMTAWEVIFQSCMHKRFSF